jgi:hypothetical protein
VKRKGIPNNNELFDCIPLKPLWKCTEDKEYYLNQRNRRGGYCTTKEVPYAIHPSKRLKLISDKIETIYEDADGNDNEDVLSNYDSSDNTEVYETGLRYGDVHFAEKLREAANLSISATIAVMEFYKSSFPHLADLPIPPSRGSVSILSRKEALKVSSTIVCAGTYEALYFDMKSYNDLYSKEREMLCLCRQ